MKLVKITKNIELLDDLIDKMDGKRYDFYNKKRKSSHKMYN